MTRKYEFKFTIECAGDGDADERAGAAERSPAFTDRSGITEKGEERCGEDAARCTMHNTCK